MDELAMDQFTPSGFSDTAWEDEDLPQCGND